MSLRLMTAIGLLALAGIALLLCGSQIYNSILRIQASAQLEVYRSESLAAHQRAAGQWLTRLPRGPVILGDSIVAGLHGPSLAPNTLVLGIGRDKISDVRLRLESYPFLYEARVLVLTVGVNDLIADLDIKLAVQDYAALLAGLPSEPSILVSPVLPVSNSAERIYPALTSTKIRKFNQLVAELCQNKTGCRMIKDLGDFGDRFAVNSGELYEADGLHLSTTGYRAWTKVLQRSIEDHVPQ